MATWVDEEKEEEEEEKKIVSKWRGRAPAHTQFSVYQKARRARIGQQQPAQS